jgi:hypothetical protein
MNHDLEFVILLLGLICFAVGAAMDFRARPHAVGFVALGLALWIFVSVVVVGRTVF